MNIPQSIICGIIIIAICAVGTVLYNDLVFRGGHLIFRWPLAVIISAFTLTTVSVISVVADLKLKQSGTWATIKFLLPFSF